MLHTPLRVSKMLFFLNFFSVVIVIVVVVVISQTLRSRWKEGQHRRNGSGDESKYRSTSIDSWENE